MATNNVRIYKGYFLHPDEKKISDYVNGANVKVTIYDSIVDARAAGYKLVKSGRRKYIKSRYITVDDADRLKIYKLSNDKYAMSIGQIIDVIRASKKKPIIMNPSVPFSGKFAQKREVLNELKKRI